MPNVVTKFRHETGMYFLFGTHVIEEIAYVYQLRYDDILLFLWCHYINKYIFKPNYYNIKKTSEALDMLRIELPHSYKHLLRLFIRLHEKGLVNKVGNIYVLDHKSPLLDMLGNKFNAKLWIFDEAMKKEVLPKFRIPMRKTNKRRRGRPYGYRKRRAKKRLFSCRTPFKSKTNTLFK